MRIACPKKKKITSGQDVASIFRNILAAESDMDSEKEHAWCIGVNNRNVIKFIELVHLGSVNASLFEPREIFRPAVFHACASVIIGHNHPSGDPAPSREDRKATKRIYDASKILAITLLDHVIVGDTEHYSFADKGELSDGI